MKLLSLKKNHLSLLIFFSLTAGFAQDERIEITPPLEIPLALSGSFGEIRSNHFHAGVDIKTQGRQGLNVKSVSRGWVNRIRVSHGGYGKALYIEHPEGYVSVYAHLKKFAPEIEAYVKSKQYENKSYEIQLFPKPNELSVEKGMLVGYSGNTGGSQGPHLHFEIRDLKNQNPLNPLTFNLPVKDTQRPQLQRLLIYKQNSDGTSSIQKELGLRKVNDSVYTTDLLKTIGEISIGLQMFDRQDLSYNKNGIYKAGVKMNGVDQILYDFDRISFEDSNDINLMVDYSTLKKRRITIQRLIRHQESDKTIFTSDDLNGYMLIEKDKSYQILVEISDFNNNRSYLEFYIEGKEGDSIPPLKQKGKEIKKGLDYLFELDKKSVYFPKNSFAENTYVDINNENGLLKIGQDHYPVIKPFEVVFETNFKNPLEEQQHFIALLGYKNRPQFLKTSKSNGQFKTRSKKLGSFTLIKDSLAPVVTPKNFKQGQWLTNFRYLEVKIRDDLSGIKKYNGRINGEWVLFEYEHKNQTLTFDFSDQKFDKSKHDLEIIVEDNVGNKKVFNSFFYRKQ